MATLAERELIKVGSHGEVLDLRPVLAYRKRQNILCKQYRRFRRDKGPRSA